MIHHYEGYYWKMGKPYGKNIVDANESNISYKIVPDPYFRRFSVEKYIHGRFDKIIYDSYLLDFRHLKPIDQMAWQKESLEETENSARSLLRNGDDRAILIENYQFEKNLCRSCIVYSIHGLQLATNRMYYKSLKDPFNGVVVYDLENRPVMMKTYEVDDSTGEFTNLLVEEWNMQEIPPLLKQLCPQPTI